MIIFFTLIEWETEKETAKVGEKVKAKDKAVAEHGRATYAQAVTADHNVSTWYMSLILHAALNIWIVI